jgi:hypothetical protein
MRKLVGALIVAFGIMLTAVPMLATTSMTIPATVSIVGVCDLTVGGQTPTPLDFGSLMQGNSSSVQTKSVVLDANTPTDVDILGTDWTGATPSNIMSVGQTGYWIGTNSSTPLTLSGQTLFSSSVDVTESLNFQVTIPDPQAADAYSQTITVTFEC